jgi:hypothetical protein
VADLAGGGGQNRTAGGGGQSHPLPPPGYGHGLAAAASMHAALVVYFIAASQSQMWHVTRKVVRPAVIRPL